MANIIQFGSKGASSLANAETKQLIDGPRLYSIDISAHPDSYIEFTANGVRTDAESLSRIAAELEKIASIIRSDVITQMNV